MFMYWEVDRAALSITSSHPDHLLFARFRILWQFAKGLRIRQNSYRCKEPCNRHEWNNPQGCECSMFWANLPCRERLWFCCVAVGLMVPVVDKRLDAQTIPPRSAKKQVPHDGSTKGHHEPSGIPIAETQKPP